MLDSGGFLICSAGSAPAPIALLTVGGVMLVAGAINEGLTKRSPIIPPRLFHVKLFIFIFPSLTSNIIDKNHWNFINYDFHSRVSFLCW